MRHVDRIDHKGDSKLVLSEKVKFTFSKIQ